MKRKTASATAIRSEPATSNEPRLQVVQRYQQILAVRNVELQVLWNRYNILAVLNAGLLLGAFGQSPQSFWAIGPRWLLPSLGVLLCALWLYTAVYGGLWLRRWETELRTYEVQNPEVYPLFKTVYESPPKGTWTQLYPALGIPVVLVAVWVFFFVSAPPPGGIATAPAVAPVMRHGPVEPTIANGADQSRAGPLEGQAPSNKRMHSTGADDRAYRGNQKVPPFWRCGSKGQNADLSHWLSYSRRHEMDFWIRES